MFDFNAQKKTDRNLLKRHHGISTLVLRVATFALVTSLSGCTTSPLWWHNPDRGFVYKGWFINVVDQATAIRECETVFTVLGCVKPASMTAFSVNNPYILRHECNHIDHIIDGAGETTERLADMLYTLLGLNDLFTAATIAFPAPDNCGAGTMAEWQNDKLDVVQRSYGKWQILPTVEEWNRMYPDKAMPNRQVVFVAE